MTSQTTNRNQLEEARAEGQAAALDAVKQALRDAAPAFVAASMDPLGIPTALQVALKAVEQVEAKTRWNKEQV